MVRSCKGRQFSQASSQKARPGRQGWIGSSLRILPEGPGPDPDARGQWVPGGFPGGFQPSLPVLVERSLPTLSRSTPSTPALPNLATPAHPTVAVHGASSALGQRAAAGLVHGWCRSGEGRARGVGDGRLGSETTPPPWERRDGIGNWSWKLGIGPFCPSRRRSLSAACPRLQCGRAPFPAAHLGWPDVLVCSMCCVLCPLSSVLCLCPGHGRARRHVRHARHAA